MFPSSFASSTIARTMLIKRAVRAASGNARSFNRAVAVSEVLMVDSRRSKMDSVNKGEKSDNMFQDMLIAFAAFTGDSETM